jgi:UDP-glucose 4-epimerase
MNNSPTYLVTGGAGFIGSSVVDEILSRGVASCVIVVDNLFNGKRKFVAKDPRVVFHETDLREGEAVARVFAEHRPEVVIHLAALHFIPYCNEHPAETMHVNVVGTQHVLDACAKHQPRALVAASSAAVYPIHDEPCSEERLAPGPTDIYGLSKWVNEQQLELFAGQYEVHCAAARFFNAIGPRETNPHLLPAILDQVKAGSTELNLGNVEPKRDYIYVGDIARAVADLAEKNRARFRAYNVGTGREHSVREIVECLSRITGKPLTIKTDPARVRKSDRMHLVADLGRIQNEIGWQPAVSLEEGLKRLWEAERGM